MHGQIDFFEISVILKVTEAPTPLNDVSHGSTFYFTGDNIAGGGGNKIQINSVGFTPNSFFVYEQLYDANKKPRVNVVEKVGDVSVIK